MSAIHRGLVPHVDDEGATEQLPITRTLGLKVEDGNSLDRLISETKSSSIDVIPESSVESLNAVFKRNNPNPLVSVKTKTTKENHDLPQTSEIPQLLQSTTDIHITTPPENKTSLDDKQSYKPTATFNLFSGMTKEQEMDNETDPDNDENQTTQLTARRKDLILLNDENKLELNQAALDDLAKIQEKIVPIARTGYTDSQDVDGTMTHLLSVTHKPDPKDASRRLVLVDTHSQNLESSPVVFTSCLSLCCPSFVFGLGLLVDNITGMCDSFMNARKSHEKNKAVGIHLERAAIHVLGEEEGIHAFKKKLKTECTVQYHTIKWDKHYDSVKQKSPEDETLYLKKLHEKEVEIWSNCSELIIGGAALNGKRFVKLLEICVEEINSGQSNVIERYLASLEEEMGTIEKELHQKYSSLLREVLPVHENILQREQMKIYTNTMGEYVSKAMFNDPRSNATAENANQKLQEKLQEEYQQVLDQNRKASAEKCSQLVKHYFKDIQTKLDAHIYSTNSREYQKDLEKAIEEYKTTPGKGPMADEVLVAHMKTLAQKGKQSSHSEKSDATQHPSAESPDTSLLREEGRGRKKGGDLSVKIYSQVYQLEERNEFLEQRHDDLANRNAELEAKLDAVATENAQLKQQLKMIPSSGQQLAEVGNRTDEATLSPVRSLSPQDTQWVHVEKQQRTSDDQDETGCICKEISEREVKLQKKIQKLREQVKELAEANSAWESHCETLKDGFSKQVTGLMQEIAESKKVIRNLESHAETHDERVSEIERKAEKQIQDAEEQKDKAISFASAQAEKMDELKRHLRKEKQHVQELEEQVKDLQSKVAALNTTIEGSRRRSLVREMSIPQPSPSIPEDGQMLHLSVENRPPPSEADPYLQSYPSSRWESIPPSLLEPQETKPCCQRLRQKLLQSETEIKVLHEQVTIYKDDFIKERRDRENAHSEIASMRSSCVQLTNDVKLLQDRVAKKSREVDALKASRAQDQYTIQQKQDHIERVERSERAAKAKVAELQAELERVKRHHIPQQPPPPYNAVPQREVTLENRLQPPAWRNQLQRNFVTFANFMKTYDVINQMYSRHLLSFNEKVRLDAMHIESDKTRYLFQNVISKLTRQELLTFKQILIDTNQPDLACLLPDEDYRGPSWHCPRCTYKNPANRDRCEMCNKRAANLEPLAGNHPAEQCDGEDVEWVQAARATTDTETEEDSESSVSQEESRSVSG